MTDREKVIKGLECCLTDNPSVCEGCPYLETGCLENVKSFKHDILRDALELLKAREPRVMTLEEVKQHNNQDGCVWFEQPTYNADAAFVLKEDFMTQVISPYILGEPINHGYWTNGNYGKTWRCWTSRPTDEQREEIPWN